MAYNPALREHAANEVDEQRIAKGLTWRALAEHIGRPPAWATAALLGSHPMSAEDAEKVGELLELSPETIRALQRQPYRTADAAMASDPTIYRFHELLAVYGPAFKALIHEQFGDGIMSAINCNVDVSRREHPDGARVVVSIDGKFLPYQWGA
ncbi:cyanase [Kineosporia babensis]|uniref:Cyanate hydratase n=1 Tax=Kineosporia babensis TaxID=499548 RepID=A0A9X1NGD1_9ACTN|nr:cyanase [Kineosporia babensis]MCD5312801.1 cyanase [Kineosporia babensis]